MNKPKVFIGSTSEVIDQGIMNQLILGLDDSFQPIPWTKSFNSSTYTLESILDTSDNVDFAILVFSSEDERIMRGEKDNVARDNVLLEYGIFLAKLGKERVIILKDDVVSIPSDISGLTYLTYSVSSETRMEADISNNVKRIKSQWIRIGNRQKNDDYKKNNLGVSKSVIDAIYRLKEIIKHLNSFANKSGKKLSEPFEFYSSQTIISSYSEALHLTNERFFTTSFLTSAFWTRPDVKVMEANEKLLARLSKGGDAKRLFLLESPVDEYLASQKRKVSNLRQQNLKFELKKLDSELDRIYDRIKSLINQGCDVKIVYDGTEEWATLPKQLNRKGHLKYAEIALYDDYRFDIFRGSKNDNISEVEVYTDAVLNFNSLRRTLEEYFERLWGRAIPIIDFLEKLKYAHERARVRIDYKPNWIARYEFNLDEEDKRLKTLEQGRTIEIIKSINDDKLVNGILDIGTCTARYPIALREFIGENGFILGIDEDEDCVEFARAKIKDMMLDKNDIHIEKIDFASIDIKDLGKFDIVTCMLGTISHFNNNFSHSNLDIAITRIKKCLLPGGIVFISNWSKYACENKKLLGIYSESDTRRIINWTLDRESLKKALEINGLRVDMVAQPDRRLDLFVCR